MPRASGALGFDVAPSLSINCPRVARQSFSRVAGFFFNRIGGVPGERQQQRQDSSYRPVTLFPVFRGRRCCAHGLPQSESRHPRRGVRSSLQSSRAFATATLLARFPV